MIEVKIEGGKYMVVVEDGGAIHYRRHGEFWFVPEAGTKMLLAWAYEHDAMRRELELLRSVVGHQVSAGKKPSGAVARAFHEQVVEAKDRRIAELEEKIARIREHIPQTFDGDSFVGTVAGVLDCSQSEPGHHWADGCPARCDEVVAPVVPAKCICADYAAVTGLLHPDCPEHGIGKCPKCDAYETRSESPFTTYACGSFDYDGRPETFKPGENCKR